MASATLGVAFKLRAAGGGLRVRPDILTIDEDEHAFVMERVGRVFEGVMTPEERGATGTFYTPAALVNDVLTAAFEARKLMKPDDPRLVPASKNAVELA